MELGFKKIILAFPVTGLQGVWAGTLAGSLGQSLKEEEGRGDVEVSPGLE